MFDVREGAPYLEARRFEQAGEWTVALEIFDRLAASRSEFADLALLGAARCQKQLEEPYAAQRALDELLSRFPESPAVPYARIELGTVLSELGLFEEATEYLEEALGVEPASVDKPVVLYALASAYLRMELDDKAAKTFERICRLAPRSEQALVSAHYLAETGTVPAKIEAVQVFISQKEYEKAARICAEILEGDTATDGERARVLFDLARCYAATDRPDEALEMYAEVADKFPGLAVGGQALLEGAWLSERVGYREDALWMRQRARNEYPGTPQGTQAQWDLARGYDRWGMPEQAVAQYAKFAHDHPSSYLADDALFRAGLMSYLLENYADAAQLFAEATEVAADRLVDDAPYWAGKAHLVSGKSHAAVRYLARCAQLKPAGFYSYRAWTALRELSSLGYARAHRIPLGADWFMILPAALTTPTSVSRKAILSPSPPASLNEAAAKLATRANFLLRHKLPEAEWDLDKLTVVASFPDLADLAQLYLYVGSYDRCVYTAERMSSYPDGQFQAAAVLPYLYPLAHARRVRELAENAGLDAFLIHAVMREESHLNERLVSGAGAVGLMQIMPATGGWIAARAGFERYDEKSLYDRYVNLQLGTWYLDYLWDEFDGNLVHVLAAYNAGPGNVKRWLTNGYGSNDVDLFIETIPFEETRNYIKKVLGAYGNYIQLYR
jgi:soluble lytic murein transglycosylase